MKIPLGKWTQPNNSDKYGMLWATKNVNLDEAGYIKLSPRAIKLLDETGNADLGVPLAIGKFGQGDFQVATSSNANFVLDFSTSALTVTEDSGTAEPTLTTDSDAILWHNYWQATTATDLFRKDANGSASATWTTGSITLTSGVKHVMEVFASRNSLCISNGNVVKQYTETGGTYTNTTDLTIPSEFEIVGLSYNNARMAVTTATGAGSTTNTKEALFFVWTGASTDASNGWGIGSDICMAVTPYKASWVILTRTGELKYFNGGGFDTLAVFPFFNTDYWWSRPADGALTGVHGNNAMTVDGDNILINVGLLLNTYGEKSTKQIPNAPSGIWCYDPSVGLYHRYSPSNSQATMFTVTDTNLDLSTNIFTVSSGTVPATGNVARYVSNDSTAITGINLNSDYYIIKVSDSTFKLATTKANAEAGIAIDLTAKGSGGSNYFLMFTLVDYGITYFSDSGAVEQYNESTPYYQDVLFGGDFLATSDLGSNDVLCSIIPYLESRGWFITPKIYSEAVTSKASRLTVKFRPLKSSDSIVVKLKDRNILGLPVSSPNRAATPEATWTGARDFYTTTDLSDAKTYLDAGGELELELVAGTGAGQTVKITSIEVSGLTYSVTVAEDVLGATSHGKSHFIVDNWRTLGSITSDDNTAGFKQFPLASASKFVQFKIEMRGSDVTIEELELQESVHKPS